jgi:hypothetical protein
VKELKSRFNEGDVYIIPLREFRTFLSEIDYRFLEDYFKKKQTEYLETVSKAYNNIVTKLFIPLGKILIEISGLNQIRYIIKKEDNIEETTLYDAFLDAPIDVDKLTVVEEKDLEAMGVILTDATSESLTMKNRIEKGQFMKQKPVVGNYRLTLTNDKKEYIFNHVSASIPFIKYGRVIIVTIPVSRAIYLDEPTGSLTLKLVSSVEDLGQHTLRYRLEGSGERALKFQEGVTLFIRTLGTRSILEAIVVELITWKKDKVGTSKIIIREDGNNNNNNNEGPSEDFLTVPVMVETGDDDKEVIYSFSPVVQQDMIPIKTPVLEEPSELVPSIVEEENTSTIYTIEDNQAWPDF